MAVSNFCPTCSSATGPPWRADSSFVMGVSSILAKRITLRGTFEWHLPFADELSLVEFSVGVGYRFDTANANR